MKIVVLDSIRFSKEQITELKNFGALNLYSRSEKKSILKKLKNAEIAVINPYVTGLSYETLKNLPKLKYVCLCSTGYETVNTDDYRRLKIKISNLPGYSTESVAEFVIACLLNLSRKITYSNNSLKKKYFEIDPAEKDIDSFKGETVRGKILGIIGYGKIGKAVSKQASSLGIKIITYKRADDNKKFTHLLNKSDFISVHLPLSKQTKNLFNKKVFAKMKPGAYFINTSRSQIVNNQDLLSALKKNIQGAAIDVLNIKDRYAKKIIELPNVIATPHSAWFTQNSLNNQAEAVIKNIKAYLKNEPINLI